MKELNWKPIRIGSTYCSPGCGRGCTWNEYQQALKSGDALAKSLGKGWSRKVTENLGWYYYALSPCHRIKVRENGHQSYTAYLEGARQFIGDATTPRAAVEYAITSGNLALHDLTNMMKGLNRHYFGKEAHI